jgi:hypothetical protein
MYWPNTSSMVHNFFSIFWFILCIGRHIFQKLNCASQPSFLPVFLPKKKYVSHSFLTVTSVQVYVALHWGCINYVIQIMDEHLSEAQYLEIKQKEAELLTLSEDTKN